MGKKTSTAKPAAPAKRVAKTKPAAKKPPLLDPAPAQSQPAPAKPKPAARKAKRPVSRAKKPAYTQDDIALRAYFIAERRQTAGLPGDAHQDWIEAERQLASEAVKSSKSKPKKN